MILPEGVVRPDELEAGGMTLPWMRMGVGIRVLRAPGAGVAVRVFGLLSSRTSMMQERGDAK